MIFGNVNGYGYWQGDANSISAITSVAIAFSLSTVDNPVNGPYLVSWDANLLQFYYTTQDNRDVYWAPGDASGDFTVIVGADDSVVALHGTEVINGTYDPTGGAFSFGSAPDSKNIIALNVNGNPYASELPTGLSLLFGSNEPGQQILAGNGSVFTPPSFAYQRSDLSFGFKYTNLPDGVYLVKDENGNYTAPPYKFQAASGDTVVNAISGWQTTNIYPLQIYINGILCQMVSGSQYDSGAGFPRNGGASYRASAYDLTVVLSWNWTDASTGFQGFVTGKYGQSSSFKGSWDGLGNFSNMTNGAVAGLSAPTNAPTDGNPPQISVNGNALTYNSVASTALSNAGTPGDVYSGSLGQQLTIYQGGLVSYVPAASIAAVGGTYNATTHQFSFGTSGNTATINNTDGSTSSAVVTATDTDGHNLATPIGGASNGNGVTELAGGLDVRGNTFTLGSWIAGSESVFGLGIAYGDAATGSGAVAQLNLSTTRAAVNWNWIHPFSDGATDAVIAMELDNLHRLLLYSPYPAPTGPTPPTIILDPVNGVSSQVPVRVLPAGDINMGAFHTGIVPVQQ